MRRDTVSVPANSHVMLQFLSDKPGLWAFHCHVVWHMEGGMLVQFLEQPTDLFALLEEKLDEEAMNRNLAFCLRSGDQAFGTEAEWKSGNLAPTSEVAALMSEVAAAAPNLAEGDRKVIVHPGDRDKASELQ